MTGLFMGFSGDANNNTPVKAMRNPTMWDVEPDKDNPDALRCVASSVVPVARDGLLIVDTGHALRARITAWT